MIQKIFLVFTICVLLITFKVLNLLDLEHTGNIADVYDTSTMRIALMLAVYVFLLSMPFVPSAEIGLTVMLAWGSSMALPVYAATLLGLSIAFSAGRFVTRLRRSDLTGAHQQFPDPLTALHQWSRERPVLQRLLRFRWLALIAVLNMPGNTAVGGGGGVAMAVGYSGIFRFPAFLACAAVAVAPVPALFLLAGASGLETWVYEWLGRFH